MVRRDFSRSELRHVFEIVGHLVVATVWLSLHVDDVELMSMLVLDDSCGSVQGTLYGIKRGDLNELRLITW